MKIDIDTLLYIIISIIIIAASSLGRRKRSMGQPQPSRNIPAGGEDSRYDLFEREDTGGRGYETIKVPENPEAMEYEQDYGQAITDEDMVTGQGEPLKNEEEQILDEEAMIVDEEEAFLREQMEQKTESRYERIKEEPVLKSIEDEEDEGWFSEADEIRRAVIYSEILKRPDY